jgi:hypothetical protein
VEAVARGRLAWVALGHEELELAHRVLAAVDVPAVVAITAPRSAATDALVADADHVVLVLPEDADPRLAELAGAGLDGAIVRGPLTAPGARTTALAGWGRLRSPG